MLPVDPLPPSPLPTLNTKRLILRPFRLDDAPAVHELASAREVAATTLTIPHPYPDGAAERWIRSHTEDCVLGSSAVFAIERLEGAVLVGAIGLSLNREHRHAELGYWIGVPHWGNGYATEAAFAILRYAFDGLRLHRVFAHHFTGNPASGRVLVKTGLHYEGRLVGHVHKWGEWMDIAQYGVVRDEWLHAHGPARA